MENLNLGQRVLPTSPENSKCLLKVVPAFATTANQSSLSVTSSLKNVIF